MNVYEFLNPSCKSSFTETQAELKIYKYDKLTISTTCFESKIKGLSFL